VTTHTSPGWWAILRTRHVSRLLTWTTVGRLPHGLTPLAIVLLVRDAGGSYAWGTTLAALYGLALAAGQPLLGRLVGRTGQTRPTLIAAIVSAVATAALVHPGTTDRAIPVLAIAAVVAAGAGAPPPEATLRALWPLLVPAHAKDAAYSLDSTSQEAAHVLAPGLVALGAVTTGPAGVLGAAAALGALGALGVATAPPSHAWRPAPRIDAGPGRLGALRSPGMWLTVLVLAAFGSVIGTVYTAGPVYAERWDAPWLSGTLPAALSCSAMLGNALWTLARWTGPLYPRLVTLTAAYPASWLGLLAATTPTHAVAAVAVSGLFFGPVLTTCYHNRPTGPARNHSRGVLPVGQRGVHRPRSRYQHRPKPHQHPRHPTPDRRVAAAPLGPGDGSGAAPAPGSPVSGSGRILVSRAGCWSSRGVGRPLVSSCRV
jgi:MFS family permease